MRMDKLMVIKVQMLMSCKANWEFSRIRIPGLSSLWPLFTLILGVYCTSTQMIQAKTFTLDEVIQEALRSSPQKKIVDQKFDKTAAEIGIGRSNALPKVDLSLQNSRNSAPYTNNEGAEKRKYGSEYKLSVNLMAPVYSFGRLQSVWDIAEASKRLNGEQKEFDTEIFLLQIISLYNSVLLMNSGLKVAEQSLNYLQKLYTFMSSEYQQGARSKMDYLRIKSQKDQAEAQLKQAQVSAQTALEKLKMNLGYNEQDFSIDQDHVLQSQFLKIAIEDTKEGLSQNKQLKTMRLGREISELTLDYYKATYLPSLSLIAGVVNDIRKPASSGSSSAAAEKDFKDLFKPKEFANYVGLSLNWNLFNGLATHYEIRKALSQSQMVGEQLSLAEKQIHLEQDESTNMLKSTKIILEAAKSSREAMELALTQADFDIREGNISLTDYFHTQTEYLQASQGEVKALIGMIEAVAYFKKSHGLDISGVKK